MSDRDSQFLEEAQQKRGLGRFLIYARLSRPGCPQGAITCGGLGFLALLFVVGIFSFTRNERCNPS
jgi:hypothetical protein